MTNLYHVTIGSYVPDNIESFWVYTQSFVISELPPEVIRDYYLILGCDEAFVEISENNHYKEEPRIISDELISADIKKLRIRYQKISNALGKARSKIQNQNFVEKADPVIVSQTRDEIGSYTQQLEIMKKKIDAADRVTTYQSIVNLDNNLKNLNNLITSYSSVPTPQLAQ